MSSVLAEGTFVALADPCRRAILERVSRGPATTTELAVPLGITLTGVLKHIRNLEEAKLVISYKVGRSRWCRLMPEGLDTAALWIAERQQLWERRLDQFETHLRQANQS